MKLQNPWSRRNQMRFREDALNSEPNPQFWQDMNRSIKHMCNPWYRDPAITVGKYVIGLANPFKNNLPLVPWL